MSDLRDLMDEKGNLRPVSEWPDGAAGAVSSLEFIVTGRGAGKVAKIKTWDKNSGLEKLAKHLGLFERDNAQQNAVTVIIGDSDAAGF